MKSRLIAFAIRINITPNLIGVHFGNEFGQPIVAPGKPSGEISISMASGTSAE